MSNIRIVAFETLRERLAEVLGDHSLLYVQFETALRDRDEAAMDKAMRSLQLYPESVRLAVEEAMLSWLFDGDPGAGLADAPTASNALH